MSADTHEQEPDRRSATLFDQSQMPIPAEPQERAEVLNAGVARVMAAQRDQIELRACDLDSLLGSDHAARTVWAFVQSLDLGSLHAKIRAVEHAAGRPAIDPAILVALWLWATIDGVGSAREVDRLCERDDAYRWICGGVGVNYHTLAQFRTRHVEWLDAQLTRSIASLLERKLVTLSVVSQDGMRVRASAKAASFRRRGRLEKFMHEARAQVDALKAELDEDAGAGTRRKQAARERAVREREERIARALATMQEIEAREPAKKNQKKEVKGPDNTAPPDDKPPKAEAEPRVSTTDPEARVMKMADGGFRPAFNAQLAVDTATQLIAGVDLVNIGSGHGPDSADARADRAALRAHPRALAGRRGLLEIAGHRRGCAAWHAARDAAAQKQRPEHRSVRSQEHRQPERCPVASSHGQRRSKGVVQAACRHHRMHERAGAKAGPVPVPRARPAQSARCAALACAGAQPHAHAKPEYRVSALIGGRRASLAAQSWPRQALGRSEIARAYEKPRRRCNGLG